MYYINNKHTQKIIKLLRRRRLLPLVLPDLLAASAAATAVAATLAAALLLLLAVLLLLLLLGGGREVVDLLGGRVEDELKGELITVTHGFSACTEFQRERKKRFAVRHYFNRALISGINPRPFLKEISICYWN